MCMRLQGKSGRDTWQTGNSLRPAQGRDLRKDMSKG